MRATDADVENCEFFSFTFCLNLHRVHNWQAKGMHFHAIKGQQQQQQKFIGKTYFLASFYLDADNRKGCIGNNGFFFVNCFEWKLFSILFKVSEWWERWMIITFDGVCTIRWCDLVHCNRAVGICCLLFVQTKQTNYKNINEPALTTSHSHALCQTNIRMRTCGRHWNARVFSSKLKSASNLTLAKSVDRFDVE